MRLKMTCLNDDSVFESDFDFPYGGVVPDGFYPFIRECLMKYKHNQFVKIQLTFGSSCVQGELFDLPLVVFK